MSELRSMFHAAAARIFERGAKDAPDDPAAWPTPLWRTIRDAGIDRVLAPEEEGGVQCSWSDVATIWSIAAASATPAPVVEANIASWLLAGTGVPVDGLCSVDPQLGGERSIAMSAIGQGASWRVDGELARVPWGRWCDTVITVCDLPAASHLVVIDRNSPGVSLAPGVNLAGELRDSFELKNVKPRAVLTSRVSRTGLQALVALGRAALMAGAIERTLDLCVEYANLRQQFGRPLAKFQAVQQNIAVLAGEAAAACAAVEAGAQAVDRQIASSGNMREPPLAAMSAKVRVGEAATRACAIAHQVHGAMGFTAEHALHRYTTRLWSWRDECGNEALWARRIGTRVLGDEGSSLWRTLTPSICSAIET